VGDEVTERQQAGVASTEDPVDGEDGLAVADLGVLERAVVRVDDTSRDRIEPSDCGGVVASELTSDGRDQHRYGTDEDDCTLLHRSILVPLDGDRSDRSGGLPEPAADVCHGQANYASPRSPAGDPTLLADLPEDCPGFPGCTAVATVLVRLTEVTAFVLPMR
jgi:hypothetical protein